MEEISDPSSLDLVFVLQGGEVVITKHKPVICKLSEIVKEALERQKEENGVTTTASVHVADLGPEEFEVLDQFLSTEKLPNDLKIKDCLQLVKVAKSFEIGMLLDQLVVQVEELMKDEDVFQVLQVAKSEKNERLYSFAINCICQRPMIFIFSDDFSQLDLTEVRAILDSEQLNLKPYNYSELPVFLAAVGWARYRAGKSKTELHETFSYFLGTVVNCVRFPLLRSEVIKKDILEEYASEFDENITLMLNEIITGMEQKTILPVVKKHNIKWWMRGMKGDYSPNERKAEYSDGEKTHESDFSALFKKSRAEVKLEPFIEACLADQTEIVDTNDITTTEMDVDELDDGVSLGAFQQTSGQTLTPPPTEEEQVSSSQEESMKSVAYMLRSMKTSSPTSPNATHQDLLSSPRTVRPIEFETQTHSKFHIKRKIHFPVDMEVPSTSSKNHVSFQDDDDCSRSSNSTDELFVRVVKNKRDRKYINYPSLVLSSCKTKYKGRNEIGTVELNNFQIKQGRKSIPVSENAAITVNGTIDELEGEDVEENERYESVLRFVRSLNLLEWLVFKPRSLGNQSFTVTELWKLKQDILFSLNGVIFLKIKHKEKEVVTNYLKDSAEILQGCTGVRSIAVSNCEFELDSIANNSKLEKLNLYRVWGDFKLTDIPKLFPNLKELRLWKWRPRKDKVLQFPKIFGTSLRYELSDPSFQFKKLKVLKIAGVKLVFSELCKTQCTNVEELRLECCKIIHLEKGKKIGLCQIFPKAFPKLKRLTFIGIDEQKLGHDCDILCVHSVVGAAQIRTLEWLRCTVMKWDYFDVLTCSCYMELHRFFEDMRVGESSTFLMERGTRSMVFNSRWQETGWKVTCYHESEKKDLAEQKDGGYYDVLDQLEYTDFELEKFYKDTVAYQNYFIDNQTENIEFPKPIRMFF